jgi:hypothetical protein
VNGRRYLVIFATDASLLSATVADVRAESELEAISIARRTDPPKHPWKIAVAKPWPAWCESVGHAVTLIAEDRAAP